MTTEQRTFEVKFRSDEAGTFDGYASIFDGAPDAYGDVVTPGAFTKSLAEHKAAGTTPLLLWQHRPDEPIGVWLTIREDRKGLAVEGRFVLEAARGREAHALLKAGALDGLSIGFRTRSAERRAEGGRVLKDVELVEISLVSLPAASGARVTSVKAAPKAKRKNSMELESKGAGADVEARVADLESSVADIETRLSSVEDAVNTVKSTAERIEIKLNRPGATVETKDAPAKIEAKAFGTFLRQGREALPADEVKALRASDDTAGGYLAPADFVAEVVKGIVQFSPVRQAARVGSTSKGSVILPKRTGQPTAVWVGEQDDRSEAAGTYGQVEIPVNEAACYVDVSNQLLEDAAVNVEAEVAADLAEEFGRLEGVSFVSGSGVKRPEGFLTNAGLSYTANGVPAALTDGSHNGVDALIDLMYSLAPFYRNRATWMMNGTTLATVRKIKDSTGQYIWQPSVQAGQPETILGRPVVEAVDMPNIAANAFPIAFGDFATGYRIFDRLNLAVLRDPYSQATKGLTRFHARRRVGGGVVLAEAFKKLKIATS